MFELLFIWNGVLWFFLVFYGIFLIRFNTINAWIQLHGGQSFWTFFICAERGKIVIENDDTHRRSLKNMPQIYRF